jgi:hypothetical protein
MILRVAWKQWREQRLPAGLLLVLGALVVLVPLPRAFQPVDLATVVFTATCVAAACGVVCGVLSLAGEQEGRARAFLDRLAPSRLAVWFARALAGVAITQAHALLLAGAFCCAWGGLGLGDVSRRCWVIPLYALVAFGLGACAAVLTRTVLGGLAVAGTLAAGSVFAGQFLIREDFLEEPRAGELLAGAVVAVGAVLASGLVHCWVDVRRAARASGPPAFLRGPRLAAARRWLWLGWRCSWPVLALFVLGVVAGALPLPGLLSWPALTLAGGLVIGSGLLEKRRGWEWLREQRLTRERGWLPGTLPRLVVAATFAGLVLAGAWSLGDKVVVGESSLGGKPSFLERTLGLKEVWVVGSRDPVGLPGNAAVFLTLWVLAGFSVGRLGVLCFTSRGVALGVGLPASLVLAGVWVPSMLNQGLAWWQALTPCALLLAACLLLDWGGDTLARRGKVSVVAACLSAALAWAGGVFRYRATEIADVGEPFAVAAFAEAVTPPEQDRAAQLLVQAAREYNLATIAVTRRLGRPEATPALPEMGLGPGGGGGDRAKQLRDSASFWEWRALYRLQLEEVSARGWPDGAAKLERWVEQVGEGGWVRHLKALGDLRRQIRRGSYLEDGPAGFGGYTLEIDGQTLRGSAADDARGTAQLLRARALLLQARGQLRPALDCHVAILTLSRSLSTRDTLGWLVANALQGVASAGLEGWAQAARQEGLLLQALQGLNGQEDALATPLDLVRGEYLSYAHVRSSDWAVPYDDARLDERRGGWKRELYRLARLAPWERERERRWLNRAYKGLVEEARLPTWEEAPPRDRKGPTHPLEPWALPLRSLRTVHCHCLCRLRALRLQLALAVYQARNGRPAARLEDLTPDLLEKVPADPWSGKPFGYRVSKGEIIPGGGAPYWNELLSVMDSFRWLPLPGAPGTPWMAAVPVPPSEPHRWVAPGRGVIWSAGEDRRDDGGMDDAQDRIFLVPPLAR